MKESCHLICRRCPETSRDVCYQSWHMLLICLSPVMCCTTLYSSALIFPMASRFVCVCELRVLMCPAEAPAWVSIGPLEQRFPSLIWSSSTALFAKSLLKPVIPWTRLACYPYRKVILLTQSQWWVMAVYHFWTHLASPIFNLVWFWYLILHIVVMPLCLLMHLFLENVSLASVCPDSYLLLYSPYSLDLNCIQIWNRNPNQISIFENLINNVSQIQFSQLSLNTS